MQLQLLQILLENIAYLVRISYENKKCNRNWIRFRYIVARSTPLALAHWLPNLYLYFCVFTFVFLCICICVALHFQQELDRIPLHCRSLGAQYEKWCNGVDFCEPEHRAICSDGRFGWAGDQCHASTSSAFLYLCICIFVFVFFFCAQRQVCVVQAGYLSCKSAWSVLDNPMDHFAFAWAWVWTELVLSELAESVF